MARETPMSWKTIQLRERMVRNARTGGIFPRKPLAPWRAAYPYCFKLHTLDGKDLVEATMREWLAENVREHSFLFAEPTGTSVGAMARWVLGPKPSYVYLVHEEDAVLFKLVWGEDVARHRREAAEHDLRAVKVLTASHGLQKNRIRDWMLDPTSLINDSKVKFEIKKTRSPQPSQMSIRFDMESMTIRENDRP